MSHYPALLRAVLIDVGFTLTVYDAHRIAALAAQKGVRVEPDAIEQTQEPIRRQMVGEAWSFSPRGTGAQKGRALYENMLLCAGAQGSRPEAIAEAASHIWDAHLRSNLWSSVFPGVEQALQALRARGLKLAVVSNSEGTIAAMLREQGLVRYFDAIFDSTEVGVAKPDPEIFNRALAACGAQPGQAVMVGDSLRADVRGAQAVGLSAALLDPFGHHPDADVPRYRGFAAFVADLLGA